MSGRFEHKIQTENFLEEKVKLYPTWLEKYYYSLANNTHATKRQYISNVCMLLDSVAKEKDITVKELKTEYFDSFVINKYFTKKKKQIIRNKPISESAIATQITVLTSFFEFMTKSGYYENNPMGNVVKRPSVPMKNEVSFLTDEELEILINTLRTGEGMYKTEKRKEKYLNRDRLLFMIPLTTGCRVSALDELDVKDFDPENHTLRFIEKREKERLIEIPDELVGMIEKWIDERSAFKGVENINALFVIEGKNECRRLSVRTIQSIVSRFSVRIGREISPHELRRTFGTTAYRESKDIYLTSRLLGHNSPTVTMRYAAGNKKDEINTRNVIMKKLLP